MGEAKKLYLTIDAGTTAIKVSALNSAFKIVASENMEYQLITEGEYITLPAETYWNYAKQGILAVSQMVGGDCICGITVTSQGETMIPISEKGKPLHDAVVWLDGRAGEEAGKIREIVREEEFYQKTGIPECNEFCPISKILWFKEKRPQIYAEAKHFLLLEDFLIYKLTGCMVTEKSLMSTTGYFDLEKDCVWNEILESIGISPDKIPPALECGEVVAKIKGEAASELGINSEATVITGAMDQVCGAIGAGNLAPGMITETTGTALCIGKTVTDTRINTEFRIPVYRHYKKELRLLLPVCMTAGIALKWFKDTFCELEKAEAEKNGEDVYELLNRLAEQSEPLAGGIIMLPYLAGSLQPYHAPEYRGGFLGVGLRSRKEDFVRALMEGVSYMLKENLLLLEEISKGNGGCIISMGGGAKSDIWCRIKAGVTGMEIHTCGEAETASAGAAMLCGLGLGKYHTLHEAASEQSVKDRYRPVDREVKLYKAGYEQYKRLLKRTIEQE